MLNSPRHTIHREHHHFGWDNANQPVLTVAPGETVEFTVGQRRDNFQVALRTGFGVQVGFHVRFTPHYRDSLSPSSGRSSRSMASRARKIRDRTVPIGQSMVVAMSS